MIVWRKNLTGIIRKTLKKYKVLTVKQLKEKVCGDAYVDRMVHEWGSDSIRDMIYSILCFKKDEKNQLPEGNNYVPLTKEEKDRTFSEFYFADWKNEESRISYQKTT